MYAGVDHLKEFNIPWSKPVSRSGEDSDELPPFSSAVSVTPTPIVFSPVVVDLELHAPDPHTPNISPPELPTGTPPVTGSPPVPTSTPGTTTPRYPT